jgi:hypothetical protein
VDSWWALRIGATVVFDPARRKVDQGQGRETP